jgi:2-polyprenyl-3-methyl-5-hydroxy-6-metoxy-1,4-benzoquinol methylase
VSAFETPDSTHITVVARTACPACGGGAHQSLYDAPYSEPPVSDYIRKFYEGAGPAMLEVLGGVRYVLLECDYCGLIYQREVPDQDLVEALYAEWINPEWSLGRARDADLGYFANFAQELMQILFALGRRPSSVRVLDFGMGWGRWALMARAFGCDVAGAELSAARLDYARSLGIPNVAWDDIPGSGFDLINTEQVFEHLVEPHETLSHLAQGLTPTGLVKISVPNAEAIHRRLQVMDWSAPKFTRNSLNAIAPLEHLNCFAGDGRSLDALAARCGLEPAHLPLGAYYRFTLPWGGAKQFAKQLVKPVYRSVLKRGTYRFYRLRGSAPRGGWQGRARSLRRR